METGPFKSCTGFEALFVQFVCEHASVITPQVHQMLNEKVAGVAFFLLGGGLTLACTGLHTGAARPTILAAALALWGFQERGLSQHEDGCG